MDRKDLEALSAKELQQLIADAASVLAARCSAPPPSSSTTASLGLFASQNAAAGGSTSSGGASIFSGSNIGGTSLFGPAARTGTSSSSLFTFGSGASAAPTSSANTSGAGKLFGGTGGGLFGGAVSSATGSSSLFSTVAASSSPTAVQATGAAIAGALGEADGDEDEENIQEEVCVVHGWMPSISLEVLDKVETGEEEEEQLWSQRSKLYRFRDDEWKERGVGEAKLMKNKATGRIRFLLRQEKTGKVAANHFVVDHHPYCDLRPNADSQKILCWCAQDWSEGQMELERFALKFGTEGYAKTFQEAFNDAKAQNSAVMAEQLKKQ